MIETMRSRANSQPRMQRETPSPPPMKEFESIRPISPTMEEELRQSCSVVVLGLPSSHHLPSLPSQFQTERKPSLADTIRIELANEQQEALNKFDFRFKESPAIVIAEEQEAEQSSDNSTFISSRRSSSESVYRSTWSPCTTHRSKPSDEFLGQVNNDQHPPLPPRSSSCSPLRIKVPELNYAYATTATARKMSVQLEANSPLVPAFPNSQNSPILVKPQIITLPSTRPRTASGIPNSPRFRNSAMPNLGGDQCRSSIPTPTRLNRSVTPIGRIEETGSTGLGIHFGEAAIACKPHIAMMARDRSSAFPVVINVNTKDMKNSLGVPTPEATPISAVPDNIKKTEFTSTLPYPSSVIPPSPLTPSTIGCAKTCDDFMPTEPRTMDSPDRTVNKNNYHRMSPSSPRIESISPIPQTPRSPTARRNTDQIFSLSCHDRHKKHEKKFSLFPSPLPTPSIEKSIDNCMSIASTPTRPRTSQGTERGRSFSVRSPTLDFGSNSPERPLPPLPTPLLPKNSTWSLPRTSTIRSGKEIQKEGSEKSMLFKKKNDKTKEKQSKESVWKDLKKSFTSAFKGKKALAAVVEKEEKKEKETSNVFSSTMGNIKQISRSRRSTLKGGDERPVIPGFTTEIPATPKVPISVFET